MHVLIVFAHPKARGSFNHAVLGAFTRGLGHAGHTHEVVDLYRIGFDPVLRERDFVFFADPDIPTEVLEAMHWKKRVLEASDAGPLGFVKRRMAERRLRGKSVREVVVEVAKHKPRDVLAQQEKLARANALALVSPIYWLSFPAILKGWVERVFSYGFAYKLDARGWKGSAAGRVPLLRLDKALVMNTTFFTEQDYRSEGLHDAVTKIIDEWGLEYPGVAHVEHVFFYAVASVGEETRERYLRTAYDLGKNL